MILSRTDEYIPIIFNGNNKKYIDVNTEKYQINRSLSKENHFKLSITNNSITSQWYNIPRLVSYIEFYGGIIYQDILICLVVVDKDNTPWLLIDNNITHLPASILIRLKQSASLFEVKRKNIVILEKEGELHQIFASGIEFSPLDYKEKTQQEYNRLVIEKYKKDQEIENNKPF